MENIHTQVLVTHSKTTHDTDCYTIKFGDTIAHVDHEQPTDEQLHWFKIGILAERERIWDEGQEIQDNVLRKLLRQY